MGLETEQTTAAEAEEEREGVSVRKKRMRGCDKTANNSLVTELLTV